MTSKRAGIAVGFVVLVVAAYARVLDGWFLSDDDMLGMVTPDGVHVAWGHVLRVFHMDWGERGSWAPLRYYRPLVVLSQALDACVWGANPLGYHLTNVALHGVNAFLLCSIALALGAAQGTAFLAGALFAVFPWCPESVAWISGRTDVLAASGTLASLLLHLRSRVSAGRRKWWLVSASLAFFVLALLAKEAAFSLPLMIFAVDLTSGFRFDSVRRSLKERVPSWVLFGLIALAYLGVRSAVLGNVWGGNAADFYGNHESAFEQLNRYWRQNLTLLFTPYNREAVGGSAHRFDQLCGVAVIAVGVGLVSALRARAFEWRLVVSAVALFVASIAPFASAIHVEKNLQSARYLYLPTVFFCLFLAALAAPALKRPVSLVAGCTLFAAYFAILMTNLTPWVEASGIMYDVTRTYAKTFGWYHGKDIERLPTFHNGAYMALYNAQTMGRPFVLEPPHADAIAAKRAVYHRLDRNIRIEPDPVWRAAERLQRDREGAEWLFPIDGSAIDSATLENLVPAGSDGAARTLTATSRASWIIVGIERGARRERLPDAEEYAYVLIRPRPESPPTLFWVARAREQFGAPRYVDMRPELVAVGGDVVERTIDGYYVYAYPLHESPRWPGADRIRVLRLDPHFSSGTFQIGFFGISHYAHGQ